jgi:hypothetical protein
MSNRFDNKKLLYILGILALGLLMTFILKIPKEKATLKASLIEFDTGTVRRIVIVPKSTSGAQFEFLKENNKWTVSQGDIVANPATGAIENIFNEILAVKPQRLAAVGKSKRKEFELSDSLSTRVKFFNLKGKELADIQIGKFSYKQATNPYNYYGGNNLEGTSYVRVNDEKEIYAVDGFLALAFSGNFSDWRDKSLIRCKREDILKITFTLPGDSSYVLVKKGADWQVSGKETDSTSVLNYMNLLEHLDGQNFKDGFKPGSSPEFQITAEGNNLLSFAVKCYSEIGSDDYILNSSLNPDVYFVSKKNGIFDQIFKPLIYFQKR